MASSIARTTMVLIATLATSVALAAQSTYDKTVDAPPGGRLTVDADVGSVSVVGSDTQQVVVHAEVEGSESFLHRLHISAGQTSSGVAVSARVENDSWLDWLGWFGLGVTRVRFAIQVPRHYPLDLRSSGGDLAMRDLNAAVHARTSGGGILLQNIVGTVYVHTSGGGIRAERLDGPAQLSTSGGPIEVANSSGKLELYTSGGGIRIQNADGEVDAASSGGSIRAQLRSNRGIRLVTSGGGITLQLPPGTRASLDAGSSGGGVTSDFPFSTSEVDGDHHLEGSIGGGGAPIYLHTSGGSIHVERSP